jgi:hypothetical protein
MVSKFHPGSVLETNICSEPTKRAADLKPKDRRTDVFMFLLETIRPSIVFLHSNEPIRYFRTLLNGQQIEFSHHAIVETSVLGGPLKICASEGPLWRKKVAEVSALAEALSKHASTASSMPT